MITIQLFVIVYLFDKSNFLITYVNLNIIFSTASTSSVMRKQVKSTEGITYVIGIDDEKQFLFLFQW